MRSARLVVPALLLALAACGGGSNTPSGPSSPASASHNAGRDCLQCHGFTVAGTVYRDDGSTFPGAVVRVTTQPGGAGDEVLRLAADASGNFHTGQAVSWGEGLYTSVTGATDTPRAMEAPLTTGACNSCHSPDNRIRAE